MTKAIARLGMTCRPYTRSLGRRVVSSSLLIALATLSAGCRSQVEAPSQAPFAPLQERSSLEIFEHYKPTLKSGLMLSVDESAQMTGLEWQDGRLFVGLDRQINILDLGEDGEFALRSRIQVANYRLELVCVRDGRVVVAAELLELGEDDGSGNPESIHDTQIMVFDSNVDADLNSTPIWAVQQSIYPDQVRCGDDRVFALLATGSNVAPTTLISADIQRDEPALVERLLPRRSSMIHSEGNWLVAVSAADDDPWLARADVYDVDAEVFIADEPEFLMDFFPRSIFFVDQALYFAGSGFAWVRVADDGTIHEAGSADLDESGLGREGIGEQVGSVVLDGHRLITAVYAGPDGTALDVFELAPDGRPVNRTRVSEGAYAQSMRIVADSLLAIHEDGRLIRHDLVNWDAEDITAQVRSWYDRVLVYEDWLLIFDSFGQVLVYQVDESGTAKRVGSLDIDGDYEEVGLLNDGKAFIAGSDRFEILDLSSLPAITIYPEGEYQHEVLDAVPYGNGALVSVWWDSLLEVDASDPDRPIAMLWPLAAEDDQLSISDIDVLAEHVGTISDDQHFVVYAIEEDRDLRRVGDLDLAPFQSFFTEVNVLEPFFVLSGVVGRARQVACDPDCASLVVVNHDQALGMGESDYFAHTVTRSTDNSTLAAAYNTDGIELLSIDDSGILRSERITEQAGDTIAATTMGDLVIAVFGDGFQIFRRNATGGLDLVFVELTDG